MLTQREVFVQRRLVWNEHEALARAHTAVGAPEQRDVSPARQQPDERAQQRALAGAVRPGEQRQLPALQREGHVLYDRDAAEAHSQLLSGYGRGRQGDGGFGGGFG